MNKPQFWAATALGALCLVLALANVTMASIDRKSVV